MGKSRVKNKTAADKYLERKEQVLKETEKRCLEIVHGYENHNQQLMAQLFEKEKELIQLRQRLKIAETTLNETLGMSAKEAENYIKSKSNAYTSIGSLLNITKTITGRF